MKACQLSATANADIEAIALYILNLNPVAADRFLNSLEETFKLLAGHAPNWATNCAPFRSEII